jgi:hypothetical protein
MMLFYRASDFAKAKALYDEATEVCKSSTVESNKKTKEPAPETSKEPVAKKTVDGPLSGTKLLLSNPKDNIQVDKGVLCCDYPYVSIKKRSAHHTNSLVLSLSLSLSLSPSPQSTTVCCIFGVQT